MDADGHNSLCSRGLRIENFALWIVPYSFTFNLCDDDMAIVRVLEACCSLAW